MRLENRGRVSSEKMIGEQSDENATRRKDPGARVGEIDLDDLFENSDNLKADFPVNPKVNPKHVEDVWKQRRADHVDRPKTRIFLQVIARILGLNFARCLSNVINYFTGRAFFEARRDYPILPMDALIVNSKGQPLIIEGAELTAKKLAERFKPQFYTICEDQAIDENLTATEIRYEVLPPRQGKNNYSILYYVKREREHMPVALLGVLLDWLRPVLWSTQSEWNAIEVNINRETGEPASMHYESSNYTGDPLSYEITSANDLHLPVKAVMREGKWTHTLYQKDNRAKAHDIDNPFEKGTHPEFAFVNWNGGVDLVKATRFLGYQPQIEPSKTQLYKLNDLPLEFLDVKTFRHDAFDLRNDWLKRRQKDPCILTLPPRKEPKDYQVINLVSAQLPSLISRSVA